MAFIITYLPLFAASLVSAFSVASWDLMALSKAAKQSLLANDKSSSAAPAALAAARLV